MHLLVYEKTKLEITMTLYDAIFTRRSVRSYRMEAIDESILNSIPEFMRFSRIHGIAWILLSFPALR